MTKGFNQVSGSYHLHLYKVTLLCRIDQQGKCGSRKPLKELGYEFPGAWVSLVTVETVSRGWVWGTFCRRNQ